MTSYLIAKYVEDPVRNEARNVGVVVIDDDQAVALFDGEAGPGDIDLRSERARRINARHTYRAWVRQWRSILDTSSVNLESSLLAAAVPEFYLERGGTFLHDAGHRSIDEIVQSLFARIVHDEEGSPELGGPDVRERTPTRKALVARGEAALRLSGATFRPRYRATVAAGDRAITATFSFAVRNGSWSYLQAVDFGQQQRRFEAEALKSAFMFEHVEATGEKITLYDRHAITKQPARDMLSLLGEYSTPVDVADTPAAAERLREILHLAEPLN